jgi:replicative DNA helicase
MSARRVLPHSLPSEASILGGIMLRNSSLAELVDLEVDDFYDRRHQVVFQAMRNLEAASRPIDMTTLEAEVGEKLDAIGGPAFLGQLALQVPTADNVVAYAAVVRERSALRKLALTAADVLEQVYRWDGETDADELLGSAQSRITSLETTTPETVHTIGDLSTRRFADIERYAQEQLAGGRALSGCPTGIAELDAKIGGWQFGIVNLLAGRPGMGKSAAALASADATTASGLGAHVFTLEDSWHAYTDRQLARESDVPAINIRRAEFRLGEVAELMLGIARLKKRTNWLVDDSGGQTVHQVIRAMRRRREKNGTRLAILDYIQLLKKSDRRMPEHEHLGECMQALAESAKVDDVAWLVCSQFNRDLEKRVDKRPQLADLRGSGELEEKCKIAVGLYRGSYYGGKPKPEIDYECDCPEAVRVCSHTPSIEEWERQIQALILKGGNGPTGRVFARWDGATTRVW